MNQSNKENYVALLGVKGGPAIRPGSNMPTSILIEMDGETILVDAGLGVSKAVCDQGVFLADIGTILITHLHSDHYLELGPLIHTAWVSGRTEPITVFGPARLKHYWDAFVLSMEDDVELRIEDEGRVDLSSLVKLQVMNGGETLTVGGLSVDVLQNDHPPITDSFSLRIQGKKHRVVLSGDTALMPEMIDFAKGADLLVHEAMLTRGIDAIMRRQTNGNEMLKKHILRSHTSAEDVGRIATEAGVKHLALNHFVPDGLPEFGDEDWLAAVRSNWKGPTQLGSDGLKLVLS